MGVPQHLHWAQRWGSMNIIARLLRDYRERVLYTGRNPATGEHVAQQQSTHLPERYTPWAVDPATFRRTNPIPAGVMTAVVPVPLDFPNADDDDHINCTICGYSTRRCRTLACRVRAPRFGPAVMNPINHHHRQHMCKKCYEKYKCMYPNNYNRCLLCQNADMLPWEEWPEVCDTQQMQDKAVARQGFGTMGLLYDDEGRAIVPLRRCLSWSAGENRSKPFENLLYDEEEAEEEAEEQEDPDPDDQHKPDEDQDEQD